ncbi:hypothetical protein BCR34DRAFT_376829 [Clohesyomyces aquaticus]|uniref:Uncharacterized protein n=1 Tax=Clohesyomyces aquaticus TaxID=1231657 RepID=A0A1Y2A6J8_9PLEO|nr:hypothetical protein BCR34DRAFT_376829 [Clohesyomyces aquaticus]
MVINSQAYRRVLESRSRVNLAPLPEQSEISSDADTMVEESAPGAQKWNIPSAILRKLTTGELDTLVKSIGGVVREQEDSDWKAKVAEVASEYQTLRKNYVKIKRHFFDMQELKDTHAKELEMMAAERGRMAAEKAELEQSKLCLEGEAERFQEFYRGVDEKRKNLIASHEKELKVKNDRIQQLQEWHAKEKATCQGLRDSNRVRVDEIDRLNLDLVAARKRAEKTAASLKECEEQLARSSDEKASQEEQLQRYRSFDPIIEQLRLISPSSPGSVGGLPERPISAQHGDQEIRLAPSQ